MTRREAREHCFKMLFCQDFYPAEEKEEQLERYFEAPKEDVTGEDGKDEILHDPFEKEEDRRISRKTCREDHGTDSRRSMKRSTRLRKAGEQDVWVKLSLRFYVLQCSR